ncbi:MAG: hypothetical protein WD875_13775 [Pirellulales bacterium]
MKQVWLRTNRRVMLLMALPLAVLLPVAVVAIVDPWEFGWGVRGVGIAVGLLAGLGLLAALLLARQPRVAFADGHVLFYIRLGRATPIPVDVVECFLLGQGPALLPGGQYAKTATTTVVVRLRERAEAWSHGEFHPLLAAWCDGYITLRGTWCEPLSVELVNRMNRLLHEAAQHEAAVQKSSRQAAAQQTAGGKDSSTSDTSKVRA